MTSPYTAVNETHFYLDTMIPYALLRGTDAAVQTLFRRIELGELTAYTSTLTFDQLAYRLVLALIRDNFPGSPLDRLRQDETANAYAFCTACESSTARLRSLA